MKHQLMNYLRRMEIYDNNNMLSDIIINKFAMDFYKMILNSPMIEWSISYSNNKKCIKSKANEFYYSKMIANLLNSILIKYVNINSDITTLKLYKYKERIVRTIEKLFKEEYDKLCSVGKYNYQYY